ncbi:MAG: AMP-binding protein [Rhizobiaceae bacterium]|nr:AMP-binding protein [Rhizobiaceae bacterium]
MDASGKLTVPELLGLQVARNPDKEFLVYEDSQGAVSRYTYREIADKVAALATHLAGAGFGVGDHVAVMLSNGPEFLVAWFATNRIGAVTVPVNVHYSADELAYLLENSDSKALVLEERFRETFSRIGDRVPELKLRILARTDKAVEGFALFDEILSAGRTAAIEVEIDPDMPSQIIYTSGTTSRPKGAVLDHRNSVLRGISVAMLLGMRQTDRICVVLPLFHVNAQFVGVIPTLTVGGTVVLLESFSATRYWSQVRSHKCDGISIVPMMLRTMLAQPPSPDDADHDVRFSFYALPTSPEEWESFERRFNVTLVEGYGLTETYGICTANPLVYGQTKRHCIGLPLPGHEVRVLDAELNEVPRGEIGNIAIAGKPLFQGYYKNPEASAECRHDGWFLTGDNGYFDEDGYLNFFDRSKDVIKRAGENIAATEVERVLNDHPKVMESAVIGVFDRLRDEAVKAYVVLQKGAELEEAELIGWCADHIAKFKVPSFIEFRDDLPKTSIGKIQKYLLKAEHKAQMEAQGSATSIAD